MILDIIVTVSLCRCVMSKGATERTKVVTQRRTNTRVFVRNGAKKGGKVSEARQNHHIKSYLLRTKIL